MIIDKAACEWFKLVIATDPVSDPTDWEASFDGGTTYVAADLVDDASAWLIAGPDYAGAAPFDFKTTRTKTGVKIRLIDNPETIIRAAPCIETRRLSGC